MVKNWRRTSVACFAVMLADSCEQRALVAALVSLAGTAANLALACSNDRAVQRARLSFARGPYPPVSAFPLDAATTLRASTLGGARALGFGERIGSIEVGKQADLVCVDLSALETQPLHNVLSQLVYATGRQQVSDVWIAGKPKLVQRELVGMDLPGIIANARQWRERIRHIRA